MRFSARKARQNKRLGPGSDEVCRFKRCWLFWRRLRCTYIKKTGDHLRGFEAKSFFDACIIDSLASFPHGSEAKRVACQHDVLGGRAGGKDLLDRGDF